MYCRTNRRVKRNEQHIRKILKRNNLRKERNLNIFKKREFNKRVEKRKEKEEDKFICEYLRKKSNNICNKSVSSCHHQRKIDNLNFIPDVIIYT